MSSRTPPTIRHGGVGFRGVNFANRTKFKVAAEIAFGSIANELALIFTALIVSVYIPMVAIETRIYTNFLLAFFAFSPPFVCVFFALAKAKNTHTKGGEKAKKANKKFV